MGSEVKAFVWRMGSTQKATLIANRLTPGGLSGKGTQIFFSKLDFHRNNSDVVNVFRRVGSKSRIGNR